MCEPELSQIQSRRYVKGQMMVQDNTKHIKLSIHEAQGTRLSGYTTLRIYEAQDTGSSR
jgi:hypothetical protein